MSLDTIEDNDMLDDIDGSNDAADADKIFCANCNNCKLVKVYTNQSRKQYVLRVRCEQKMWKKKLGEEKLYKYFTVSRRTMDECSEYSPMGDHRTFLKELRKNLPIKDEIYREINPSPLGSQATIAVLK